MRRALLALLLIPLPISSLAQSHDSVSIQPATRSELGTEWSVVQGTPPTLTLLPKSPAAHPGSIWVRSAPEGLHLWGKVPVDAPPRWPQQKSEVLASDHVEVWLAADDTVPMPPIGWGNQFTQNKLKSPADCAGLDTNSQSKQTAQHLCELWFAEQVAYRRALPHLFVRQWLLAGEIGTSHVFEDFATTANRSLQATLFREDQPTLLAPATDDGVTAQFSAEYRQDAANNSHQAAYTFHLFLPYTAFPPTRQLTPANLSLMVDVFSAAPDGGKIGAFSSTSPNRQWGKPETFNHVHLLTPPAYAITPCQAKPLETDLYGAAHPAWFLPNASGDITTTFALINPAEGYLYDPGGVSPAVEQAHFFSSKLPSGPTICGPALAWQQGPIIRRTNFTVDEKSLATKPLPDGWTLLRSGPVTHTHNQFASGQCGACVIADLDVFAVSPTGEVTPALQIDQDLSGQSGQPGAADLQIAPDWSRITLFTQFVDYEKPKATANWTSTTYCLAAHRYTSCAHSDKATPPKPANFPDLRDGEL